MIAIIANIQTNINMLWGWICGGEYRTAADRIPILSLYSLLDHYFAMSRLGRTLEKYGIIPYTLPQFTQNV
jgi:hypothetical protein